ncbi:class A beta-lactamase [Arthrobacter oryzae]|jgi:beta-lactamase class A|uniref:class A beta-lactamase n=1 Tax=Arthrobacter oryzae TaxID=409290 RepID=UPI0027851883|nr:class A beta-lactamase [Arthrobacter oryzae]MDQ0076402.1 beta-lactamase class A [Arthrobacter oryzae]
MAGRNSNISRRTLLAGTLAAPVAGSIALAGAPVAASYQGSAAASVLLQRRDWLSRRMERLERDFSARVGLFVADRLTGAEFGHRADERFAMCSTFKVYAAAALLQRAWNGLADLNRGIPIDPAGVVVNSPECADFAGSTLPLKWFCKVALTHSDNTAGNQLLEELGGPAAIGAYARSLGDTETRLDRWEPELNNAERGDPRDTSTPRALAQGYRELLLGGALNPEPRSLLTGWMLANVTSGRRIRAGLPDGWTSADKTGAGLFGTVNDVGVIWNPAGEPLVLSILTDSATDVAETPGSNELVAAITRAVTSGK